MSELTEACLMHLPNLLAKYQVINNATVFEIHKNNCPEPLGTCVGVECDILKANAEQRMWADLARLTVMQDAEMWIMPIYSLGLPPSINSRLCFLLSFLHLFMVP